MRKTKQIIVPLMGVVLLGLSAMLIACGTQEAQTETTATPLQYTAVLEVQPKTAHVGEEITITGSGLPRSETVEIVWGTLEGHFKLGEYQEFEEQYFTETSRSLASVQADAGGRITYEYQLPEDYGGFHNITAYVLGQEVGKTSVEIRPRFEVTPLSGPPGTEITITATGIGYRKWEDARSINWDNKLTGFFNGVVSNGSSTVRIRATGSPGPHNLTIWNGYYPYLNIQQAPTYYLPPVDFTFTVTDGEPAFTGWIEDWPEQDYSELENFAGTTGPGGESLEINPNIGIVGTDLTLTGTGFEPDSTIELHWEAMRGNRRAGWNAETMPLTTVQTDENGTFVQEMTMPDDLGGYHAIVATVSDKRVADARVIIQPSVVEFTPTSGPQGTTITLHLKGVGWTELDNIYVMTYDNAFTGYACGFNTGGDVTINYTKAAGEPGWHFISLWPSVYQGASLEQYNTPWLDYHTNHPGLPLPAFHFAFEITE